MAGVLLCPATVGSGPLPLSRNGPATSSPVGSSAAPSVRVNCADALDRPAPRHPLATRHGHPHRHSALGLARPPVGMGARVPPTGFTGMPGDAPPACRPDLGGRVRPLCARPPLASGFASRRCRGVPSSARVLRVIAARRREDDPVLRDPIRGGPAKPTRRPSGVPTPPWRSGPREPECAAWFDRRGAADAARCVSQRRRGCESRRIRGRTIDVGGCGLIQLPASVNAYSLECRFNRADRFD